MNTIQPAARIENSRELHDIVANSKLIKKADETMINHEDQKEILSPSTASTEKIVRETLPKFESFPNILEENNVINYEIKQEYKTADDDKGNNVDYHI